MMAGLNLWLSPSGLFVILSITLATGKLAHCDPGSDCSAILAQNSDSSKLVTVVSEIKSRAGNSAPELVVSTIVEAADRVMFRKPTDKAEVGAGFSRLMKLLMARQTCSQEKATMAVAGLDSLIEFMNDQFSAYKRNLTKEPNHLDESMIRAELERLMSINQQLQEQLSQKSQEVAARDELIKKLRAVKVALEGKLNEGTVQSRIADLMEENRRLRAEKETMERERFKYMEESPADYLVENRRLRRELKLALEQQLR